jgi:Asp-tRNA(Asn)/Glu-tRNA(Gln) amidotransferase A subunit family amidase
MQAPVTPRLETFTDWLHASRGDRARALAASLDRIREQDRLIQAWVHVAPQPGAIDGVLAGIPFGVKEIIETAGLPIEYGSPVYKGRIGTFDAPIVTSLRQRGATVLGITRSTPFAYRTPTQTRNPRNLDHTPGGSSSGSAAAVAAGMVPFALGTQTLGSVLRPAAFCGVTGFKPTYGLLPMEGVLRLSASLDTLGLFTHTPADMVALWESMGQPSPPHVDDAAVGVPDPIPDVEPSMAKAFEQAVDALRSAGVIMRSLDIAPMLTRLDAASRTVMFFEGAHLHRRRYEEHGDALAGLADLVREGLRIAPEQYDEATRDIAECRRRIAALYETTPVIVVPAAPGPAPHGLGSTGDPRINSPWTALGTPAISIPIGACDGLPLGLQITASHGEDARLLRAAVRVDRALRRRSQHT